MTELLEDDDTAVVLDGRGMAAARPFLQALIGAFTTAGPLIRLDCDPGLRLPPTELALIGEIASEAIANALRHAFPVRPDGHIWVRLEVTGDRVQLTVRDDGIGIGDIDASRPGGAARIVTAADNLGGRVRMGSAPFGGGAVTLSYRSPVRS